jgi:hypothetical protein
MTSSPSDTAATPSQILEALRILHFTFVISVVMYVIIGEVIRFAVDDFTPDGFVNLGGATVLVRLALFVWSVAVFALTRAVITDERMLERGLSGAGEVNDLRIAEILQTSHILRVALWESVAVMGFTLYLMTADRFDLYVFCGLALVNLLSIVPGRERWETKYRSLAARYPTVSATLA